MANDKIHPGEKTERTADGENEGGGKRRRHEIKEEVEECDCEIKLMRTPASRDDVEGGQVQVFGDEK